MRHWLRLYDSSPAEIAGLVALARDIKSGRARKATEALRNRILTMVFFNPSLRTRASFESAMARFGGTAITLNVGGDAWQLEHRDGVVMNGDRVEHVREAVPVLARYCDVLGVRTFARLADPAEDAADSILRAFATHSTVPVVSLESALEHPCQGLADRMTMEEKLGAARGKRFALTWAPHVKPLPMAVPHSAVLAAASAGMHVTIAHPPGYSLNAEIVERAAAWCREAGASFNLTHEQSAATRNADIVYVKSWGSASLYGKAEAQTESFRQNADWMVTPRHLGADTRLMHCLPVRRNVVITDEALDAPRCIVVDQAENRLWAQAAILSKLLGKAV